MAITLTAARAVCSGSRWVFSGASPKRMKIGASATIPKNWRKKAISSGCNSFDTWCTAACIATKATVDKAIQAMPRRLPDRPVAVIERVGFKGRHARW